MSIAEAVQSDNDCREIKRALEDIGCPICDGDTIKDIPEIIRKKCHHGPQHVFNAVIEAGPGIKARLINGKGYKISANDKAELSEDLTSELVAGTTVHKALFTIINKLIPAAAKFGANSPYIVDVEFVKTNYAGDDAYYNRYYSEKGRGRRTGLRPGEWYLKIYVVSQIEPIYCCLGEVLSDIQAEIMTSAHKMCDEMIQRALKEFSKQHGYDMISRPKPVKPQVPCPPNRPPHPELHHDHRIPFEEIDEIWDKVGHGHSYPHYPHHHHHGCNPQRPDVQFPEDLDPGFSVMPEGPDVNIPENLDPGFSYTPDNGVQFPETLDPGFSVMPETPQVNVDGSYFPDMSVKPEPPIKNGSENDNMAVGAKNDDDSDDMEFIKFLNTL